MIRLLVVSALTVSLWTCGNSPGVTDPEVDAGSGAGGGGALAGTDAGGGGGGGGGGGTSATGGGTGGGGSASFDAGRGGGGGAVAPDAGTGGGAPVVDAGTGGGVGPGTPDAGTVVRFVAVGDTGKGNAGQFQVGQAIGTVCAAQGCDFVALLGDNFYPTGVSSVTDPQWDTAFVQPYAPVNAPFQAVLGNHDCGGDGAGYEFAKGDVQVEYSQVNPKWRMPATHYRFTVGHVEFFVADTNRSMFNLDDAVETSFAQWLPQSTATWKIAMGHHPYKSNGKHGNAGNYDGIPAALGLVSGSAVKSFLENHVCGQADFYLSGHDHNLQWLQATCSRAGSALQTNLIVSGGGAATTALQGSQPVHYQSDALGFVYVVIRDRTLTASFYDGDGVQKFTRSVTK